MYLYVSIAVVECANIFHFFLLFILIFFPVPIDKTEFFEYFTKSKADNKFPFEKYRNIWILIVFSYDCISNIIAA